MHLSKRAPIVYQKLDRVCIVFLNKYANFVDEFLPKLALKLPKYTKINKFAITFVDNWQPLYNPIHSLSLMVLKILRTYIKSNLASGFIGSTKSPTRDPIFFNKKLNRSLRLYIDYRSLNYLTIKNLYPLLLIEKLLDWLSQTRQFF